MRSIMMLLLFCQLATAEAVKVRVVDESDAPIKDVLVIIQNLSKHEAELLRVLSDADGYVGRGELQPGLYRLIATTPYGLWRTTIKEFMVKSAPLLWEPLGLTCKSCDLMAALHQTQSCWFATGMPRSTRSDGTRRTLKAG
jgi:hypothetical protein